MAKPQTKRVVESPLQIWVGRRDVPAFRELVDQLDAESADLYRHKAANRSRSPYVLRILAGLTKAQRRESWRKGHQHFEDRAMRESARGK